MIYNTAPYTLSILDWKAVWSLRTVLCGNQECIFAWKSREGILHGFPKSHTTLSFISTSPNTISWVEFRGGFPVCKLKVISNHRLLESHPSYLLVSICPTCIWDHVSKYTFFKDPHSFNDSNILHSSKVGGKFGVRGCGQFSRCPHCWLSLMLFLITCAFKLISSAVFWPSVLKRFSLLTGVPQAWEDILIFTSVILLSQSSAACENKLSFIRMHTQIFMFDYLISSPPHKKKTNNPET